MASYAQPYVQLTGFVLLTWLVKRLGDAVAKRIGDGDKHLVAAIDGLKDAVGELKNMLIAQREENRFLRESFGELTSHFSDLLQRWRVADAIHELHNQEQAEVHTMVTDVARATVDRDTGVHRLDAIQKVSRDRAAEREELMRQSAPPPRRRG